MTRMTMIFSYKYSAVFLSFVLLIMACGTTGGTKAVDTIDPEIQQESLKQITLASPESLLKVQSLIIESGSDQFEEGRELLYVAERMFNILYPLLDWPDSGVLPPAGTVYIQAFDEITQGVYPVLDQQEGSPLSFVIPPLSLLYDAKGNVDEQSLNALQFVDSLSPLSILPPYLLGVINERNQDWDQALEDFSEALSRSGDCYPAALRKAILLSKMGRYQDAVLTLKDLELPIQDNPEIQGLYAEFYFQRGDYKEALKAADEVLAQKPENEELLILRLKILVAQGDLSLAEKLLPLVEKTDQKSEDILLLKANISYLSRKVYNAMALLKKGMEEYPNNLDFLELYGRILLEQGNIKEGREVLMDVVKKDPTRLLSSRLLFKDAVESKMWASAERYMRNILKLKSNDPVNELGYTIYMNLGEKEKALAFAKDLYTRNKNSINYLLTYIRALISSGNSVEAELLITHGFETAGPGSEKSALYYLRSLIQKNKERELEDLRSALYENLQNYEALVAISKVYESMKDYGNAYRYLKQALALRPDEGSVKFKLGELKKLIEQ